MSSKVLVVDDDPFLLRNLEVLLNREGYSVRGAASGEEALSLLTEDPADLVVLDLGPARYRRRHHVPALTSALAHAGAHADGENGRHGQGCRSRGRGRRLPDQAV